MLIDNTLSSKNYNLLKILSLLCHTLACLFPCALPSALYLSNLRDIAN